jgi:hypothetical protein
LGKFIGIFQRFTKSKISNFDITIIHENVIWLDISVHDIATRKNLECLDNLLEVEENSLLGEGSLLLHEFIESSTVAVLIDEVEVVGGFEHIDVLDDVGAALEGGKNVNFIDSALL